MTRDVLVRKLAGLDRYLLDLRAHEGRSEESIREDPYEIERLLELMVQVAVDIVTHELAELDMAPNSYRDSFQKAAEAGLLPDALARKLADAAGLRNVLVHMYDEIDYAIVAKSVGRALEDFTEFLDVYRDRIDPPPPSP